MCEDIILIFPFLSLFQLVLIINEVGVSGVRPWYLPVSFRA